MQCRGVVVDVGEERTVDTACGSATLAEVRLRPDGGAASPVTVPFWDKWTETAAVLDPGMSVACYDLEERTYRGETQYTTTAESMIVVEPEYLVDVTDVRQWVQCPRLTYLGALTGGDLADPLLTGTIVHEVFGDLLRGRAVEDAVADRVTEAGLELGLIGADREAMCETVRQHATAIENWLAQGTLTGRDEWRSEQLLLSERYGLKGRADAVRRGTPVELKTGKNTKRAPRFEDKVQATCYALLLGEHGGEAPDTGTLLYTKNATVERADESGDLSPAKDFRIGPGLRKFVLRARNELAAMAVAGAVPTGYEGEAVCEYCFEQDTCMAVSGRLAQESKAGQVGRALPAEERAYVERFSRAIEAERRAVHREFAKLWEQPAAERARADRALIDLEPTGRRQLEGGRWELRARGTGAVSKIREGDLVLASAGDPLAEDAELARVERLGHAPGDAAGEDADTIVVTADEPVSLGRLDVYPSELFADRLLTALHDGVLTRPAAAKDVLFDRQAPAFATVDATFVENNEAQNAAVRRAVAAEDCALVHGPPGTGKTFTLARAVRALVDRGERVLLSAFTNRAVDNAIATLADQGFTDVVRMGTESGVSASAQAYRLDPAGDPQERASMLESAPVVAATTATCGSRVLRTQSFDVAVVDEAGQLTEPGTLAAVARAERFVLVGDHEQLPPVVRAETGDRESVADLERSMFARLVEDHPEAAVSLERQYRMAQRIQSFPSREFYDGGLRPANGAVAGQSIGDLDGVTVADLPAHLTDRVVFIDPDGAQTGNTNPTEASAVADVVEAYLAAGVAPSAIGVIAPYRAQVAAIDRRIDAAGVVVDTVDRFQGSSTEIVIVSFTATGSLDGPIFEDHRRVNVALTRAKKALVLVGEESALGSEALYSRLLDWAR